MSIDFGRFFSLFLPMTRLTNDFIVGSSWGPHSEESNFLDKIKNDSEWPPRPAQYIYYDLPSFYYP